MAVMWSPNMSGEDLRYIIESYFNYYWGGYSIAGENNNGKLGNIPATTVAYNLNGGDFAVLRYTDYGGYSIAVIYIINSTIASQDTITYVDSIVQSFSIKG
jgi:hypothetical protein